MGNCWSKLVSAHYKAMRRQRAREGEYASTKFPGNCSMVRLAVKPGILSKLKIKSSITSKSYVPARKPTWFCKGKSFLAKCSRIMWNIMWRHISIVAKGNRGRK